MNRRLVIVGHRGSSDHYRENTIEAFDAACREGAYGIETDVRKSADGTYVLMHDTTIDRTTDGTGRVDELSWEQLKRFHVVHKERTGASNEQLAKIPRLDTVLERYRLHNIFLFLQVKIGLDDCIRIARRIELLRMENQCFLFTNKDNLKELRRQFPQLLIVNDGMNHDGEQLLAQAVDEGWTAISPGVRHINEDLVKKAHALGKYVVASYVASDYEKKTKELIQNRCNFILGNDCARMVQVTDRLRKQQTGPADGHLLSDRPRE